MATTESSEPREIGESYPANRSGFKQFLHDKADQLFPFGGYRDYQKEILFEAVDALFLGGYRNIIIDGPTGIGKSPINVTIGRLFDYLARNKAVIEAHFNHSLHGVDEGKSFYTTPQKQLRNQLANDDDLAKYVQMLKSRADYICGASGDNCKECSYTSGEEDLTCRNVPACTYWGAKVEAMKAKIAVLTFAMLVVDNNIPVEDEKGGRLSFDDRDVVIVDEGHNLEGQVASLFAGFSVSSWKLPDEVYKGTAAKIEWGWDRYEDVEHIINELIENASTFVEKHEDNPDKEILVDQCENFLRKASFCQQEVSQGRPWVVTVDTLADTEERKFDLKPVDVDNFLSKFIWSRGNKRVISSATIPYRENIERWADRIGLDGSTKLISKPMPFPEENRLIHKNTIVGSMSGDGEEKNWPSVIDEIKNISSKHEDEKGLIHTTSYKRANEIAESLNYENLIVQDRDKEKSRVIEEWYNSDKDILLSPSMMEGVDLYDDRCRWQILVKVPYGYVGDSRVSYLLNERHDWEWYNQTTMLNVIQSVGRAVRGPEDHPKYYVIDKSFDKIMAKVATPDWFSDAVRKREPKSWGNSGLDEFY